MNLRLRPRLIALLLAAFTLTAGLAAWNAPVRAQQRPNISAALIRASDLPAGWTATALSDLDLENIDLSELAGITPQDLGLNPAGRCAMALTPLLRQLAAQPPAVGLAVFQRSELGPFLAHVVIVAPPGLADLIVGLANPGAASAIGDACRSELMAAAGPTPDFDLASLEEQYGLSVQSTPLKVAQVGDRSVAMRTDITLGFLGTSLISVLSVRGNALSMLFLLTDPNSASTSLGLMEQLAQTADQRLVSIVGR